jgi:carbamoyl-phosphate synthase small subunit
VEGLRNEEDCVFSLQFHPESAPGPQDGTELFEQFAEMMRRG